ncbi:MULTISPECIES: hypothetical protein [unclassified Streptomyces]|uniref:hypothetical protein n=1 Tax=unclassified Streptomyces TaxID=2593676 RepID=UPI0035E154C0
MATSEGTYTADSDGRLVIWHGLKTAHYEFLVEQDGEPRIPGAHYLTACQDHETLQLVDLTPGAQYQVVATTP